MTKEIPDLSGRYALSVDEATVYFCIGQKKICLIAEENIHAGVAFTNGD